MAVELIEKVLWVAEAPGDPQIGWTCSVLVEGLPILINVPDAGGLMTNEEIETYLSEPVRYAALIEQVKAESVEAHDKPLLAPDYLTESPPLPADAAEAKAWLEAEMAKATKSHVLMTFCQYVMANDQDEFRNAYVQAISDLEQIEGFTDLQIENNLANIIRGMATIQRKTLKALKKIFLG